MKNKPMSGTQKRNSRQDATTILVHLEISNTRTLLKGSVMLRSTLSGKFKNMPELFEQIQTFPSAITKNS